jgi:hypothetical protein
MLANMYVYYNYILFVYKGQNHDLRHFCDMFKNIKQRKMS